MGMTRMKRATGSLSLFPLPSPVPEQMAQMHGGGRRGERRWDIVNDFAPPCGRLQRSAVCMNAALCVRCSAYRLAWKFWKHSHIKSLRAVPTVVMQSDNYCAPKKLATHHESLFIAYKGACAMQTLGPFPGCYYSAWNDIPSRWYSAQNQDKSAKLFPLRMRYAAW